jgi:hypothetical protein
VLSRNPPDSNGAEHALVVFLGRRSRINRRHASVGLTKVLSAADGMKIDFTNITGSSTIVDETSAVASSTSLTTGENAYGPSRCRLLQLPRERIFHCDEQTKWWSVPMTLLLNWWVSPISTTANIAGLVTLHV